MRKPRVEDFDPRGAPPRLGSPTDNIPALERPAARAVRGPLLPPVSEPDGATKDPAAPPRTYAPYGTPVRPVRRRIRRWPYELYEDQIETLRRLAAEDILSGGRGSASELVREAIDHWLARRAQGEE
jgi:hypothetical protein